MPQESTSVLLILVLLVRLEDTGDDCTLLDYARRSANGTVFLNSLRVVIHLVLMIVSG